jgi:hypothetical protein
MGGLPTNEAEAYENLEHVYRHLASQGKLPVRVFAFMPLTSWYTSNLSCFHAIQLSDFSLNSSPGQPSARKERCMSQR